MARADALITASNGSLTGRIATAIAIAAVVSVATLVLLYSGMPFFGQLNDLTNAFSGLLMAMLAWRFHAILRHRAPVAAVVLLMVAWTGSAAIVVNSLLVALGRMDWMTGGMYTGVGYGLLGIWLMGFLRLAGPQPFLTTGLARLGTVAASAMLFGLLAAPALAAGREFTQNPLIWIAYAGAAAVGWLLFPLWCWLVGRMLISGAHG
jgi:hypothetical protein